MTTRPTLLCPGTGRAGFNPPSGRLSQPPTLPPSQRQLGWGRNRDDSGTAGLPTACVAQPFSLLKQPRSPAVWRCWHSIRALAALRSESSPPPTPPPRLTPKGACPLPGELERSGPLHTWLGPSTSPACGGAQGPQRAAEIARNNSDSPGRETLLLVPSAFWPPCHHDGPRSLPAPGRARPIRKGKAGVRGPAADRGEAERRWRKPLSTQKWGEPEKGKEGRERKEQGGSPGVEGGYHQGGASPFEITVINRWSQGQAKSKSLWPKAKQECEKIRGSEPRGGCKLTTKTPQALAF